MSQWSRQKFVRTFRKTSCKRGVFLVFLDLGWGCGPLWWSGSRSVIWGKMKLIGWAKVSHAKNLVRGLILTNSLFKYQPGKRVLGADMTGRPGDCRAEINGRSIATYLVRTPCVPLFMLVLRGLEAIGGFRLPGATWDHFGCTVELPPGHIRCRVTSMWTLFGMKNVNLTCDWHVEYLWALQKVSGLSVVLVCVCVIAYLAIPHVTRKNKKENWTM